MKLKHIVAYATQYLTVTAFSILLVSCSTQYQVSTNLDKENFKQYFAPTSVKIYQSEQDFNSPYQFIGAVEGQDCQEKVHLAAPDKIIARTHARAQAFKQNANAIIFTGCALIEDDKSSKQCINTLVCYGKAYVVSPNKQ
ncbi:MAG: RcsF protein [Alteromonadaceae bacterium]|jgi:RcsF protein